MEGDPITDIVQSTSLTLVQKAHKSLKQLLQRVDAKLENRPINIQIETPHSLQVDMFQETFEALTNKEDQTFVPLKLTQQKLVLKSAKRRSIKTKTKKFKIIENKKFKPIP